MLLRWLIALAPIAVVLGLMLGRRWSAGRAGLAGWLVALVLAATAFGAGPELLLVAQGKALLLAAYVLYIIWMALLLYHVLNEAGAITAIGAGLTALTPNRGLQALILGWAFGSFLQGVSGYGVPTAVVAPLLVGLGFAPVSAVVIASLGHAWAVTFGSLAASFHALVAAARLPPAELAPSAAIWLGLAGFGCGLAVLWAAGGARLALAGLGPVLVLGLAMSGTQLVLALAGLYPLAAVGAGLVGMGAAAGLARIQRRQRTPAAAAPAHTNPGEGAAQAAMPVLLALLPYALLIVIIGLAEFAGPVGQALDTAVVRIQFPEVSTAEGFATPAEVGRTLSLFGHPGALLAYTALLVGLLYAMLDRYPAGTARRIAQRTVRAALLPSLGIAAMVAMATTMEHAGMTRLLAEGLARAVGGAFPLAAPWIGALGAFMTGSNTNSNVVFTSLQAEAAQVLELSPALILAAQTAGGAIGSAFAPAKIIVGCSTVGFPGCEGPVLRSTLVYGGLILLGLSALTFLAV